MKEVTITNLLIYKTMILPYFDYGDILFMKCEKHFLSKPKLVHLQKKNSKRSTSADVAYLGRRREAHTYIYIYYV